MYVCTSCGSKFFEPRHFIEAHGFNSGNFEEWDGCPNCGESGYTEVEQCLCCGEHVDISNLYQGICYDCLKRKLNYQNALDYLQSNEIFGAFFCWWLNGSSQPETFCSDLLDVFEEIYRRRVANDLLTNSTEFLDLLREYIFEDDGEYGKDGFAKFIKSMEG